MMSLINVMAIQFIMIFGTIPNRNIIDLLDCESCDTFHTWKVLPSSVIEKMSECIADSITFADANQKFNQSDAVEDEKIPFRRIVFITKSSKGNEWLIYYEKGGRSHISYLTYAALGNDNLVKCIYNLSPHAIKNNILQKNELKDVIKSGEYTIVYNNGKSLRRPYIPF